MAYLGVTGCTNLMHSCLGGKAHNIAADCGDAPLIQALSYGLNPVRESVVFPAPRPVRRPSHLP